MKPNYTLVTKDFLNIFKQSLESNNRFFANDTILTMLNDIVKSDSVNKIIKKDTKLYRARIYREEDDKEEKSDFFKGYGPIGSGVNSNQKWANAGRMNPEGICVLYLSTGETTCVKEIGAASGELVSVAMFNLNKDLKIADFSKNNFHNGKRIFFEWIQHHLSCGYPGKDYVITQFVAMFCKSKGFNGIKYRSKYATKNDTKRGYNIALFDYDDCIAISSKINQVKQISLSLIEYEQNTK